MDKIYKIGCYYISYFQCIFLTDLECKNLNILNILMAWTDHINNSLFNRFLCMCRFLWRIRLNMISIQKLTHKICIQKDTKCMCCLTSKMLSCIQWNTGWWHLSCKLCSYLHIVDKCHQPSKCNLLNILYIDPNCNSNNFKFNKSYTTLYQAHIHDCIGYKPFKKFNSFDSLWHYI